MSCHSLVNFNVVSKECVFCHVDIHQGKMARTCEQCHSTRSWNIFSTIRAHANTIFPLIGAHAKLDCHSCHLSEIEGEFSMLKSECISCHIDAFNSAQNPSHSALGFGTRCNDCHNLLSWRPADFSQHNSFFPIYSGAHSGKWNSCYDCHPTPGDYSLSTMTCFSCHQHDQGSADSQHREVAGYVYESSACYSCHRSGSAGG